MLPLFDDDLFLPGPCSHFTSLEAGVQFTVSSRTTILRCPAILPNSTPFRQATYGVQVCPGTGIPSAARSIERSKKNPPPFGVRTLYFFSGHFHQAFCLAIWGGNIIETMLWHKDSQAPKEISLV